MRISSDRNNRMMVRPTLVVGLGGTGGLVSGFVEKFTKELFDGALPPFVRFLNLDTDSLEEGAPDAGQADLINLFHHMDLGEVLRDFMTNPEMHPHLSWLKGIPLDTSSIDHGCKGIPALGRVVFTELRDSIIHQAVSARWSDLRANCKRRLLGEMEQFRIAPGGSPVVHLTSSLCGGTGAGMLIDMAYNLRWWSREAFPRSAEIVGHLLLPEAFGNDPDARPKLEANAATLLEQIEFLSDARRPDVYLEYARTKKRIKSHLAPFNFLYLINGQGTDATGDREQLVQTIARVIRALILEPIGQRVTSDVNNKSNDALTLKDPANGRLRCFSSYGHARGVPGHRRDDIDDWLCHRLEDLMEVPPASAPAGPNVDKALEDIRLSKLSMLPNREEWTCSPWQSQDGKAIRDHILNDFRGHLERELKKLQVRASADDCIPPEKPLGDVISNADATVQNCWRPQLSGQFLPLSTVAVCLEGWETGLAGWPRRHHSPGDSKQLIEPIIAQATQELNKRGQPQQWQLPQVSAWINPIADGGWPAVQDAILRNNLLSAARKTAEVFHHRTTALGALVDRARSGYLDGGAAAASQQQADRSSTSAAGESSVLGDLYAYPLEIEADPTEKNNGEIPRLFREMLLQPILENVVMCLREPLAELATTEAVMQRLERVLTELAKAKGSYLDKLDQSQSIRFHSALAPGEDPSNHECYEAVNKVYELASPLVDLHANNVYRPPLETAICQQAKQTCVPQLLAHNRATRCRKASISPQFEKNAGRFQLLRTWYGFCLPAMKAFDDYRKSAVEYAEDRGFKTPSLFWFDRRWFDMYAALSVKWRQVERKAREAVKQETIETIARSKGEFLELLEQTETDLRKAIGQLQNTRRIMRATEALAQTRSEIEAILAAIPPDDREHAERALDKCRQMLAGLRELITDGSVSSATGPAEPPPAGTNGPAASAAATPPPGADPLAEVRERIAQFKEEQRQELAKWTESVRKAMAQNDGPLGEEWESRIGQLRVSLDEILDRLDSSRPDSIEEAKPSCIKLFAGFIRDYDAQFGAGRQEGARS